MGVVPYALPQKNGPRKKDDDDDDDESAGRSFHNRLSIATRALRELFDVLLSVMY